MDPQNLIVMKLPPMPYYLEIGRTRYAPGESHPNRRNLGVFDWLFLLKGTLFLGEDEKTWEVSQGQSLLLLPDRYHYTTEPCREETEFYWVHFDFRGNHHWHGETDDAVPMRNAWANPGKLSIPQYAAPRSFARAELLLGQLLESSGERRSNAYWKEQQLFLELLQEMDEPAFGGRASVTARKLAERIETYLRQHYQTELTNEMLADAFHFHPNYIVRCMKEMYRCTPMEYLHRYRIEQAKLLLIKTEWPMALVAEQVGFRTAPYFSNCFKRQTGLSPLAFRKRHSE
ncbi:helix-turn-helix domain-containing protein [Cohnella caldifontis]|uniref:helix-turn-helix domain-containing protein n=1 Tax=Cohnella caldifontis TaxID=3027471 RepID=UPI0023EB5896|nr:AraC family transcriptional regulator [Cohnella sp. YIM B05605]